MKAEEKIKEIELLLIFYEGKSRSIMKVWKEVQMDLYMMDTIKEFVTINEETGRFTIKIDKRTNQYKELLKYFKKEAK